MKPEEPAGRAGGRPRRLSFDLGVLGACALLACAGPALGAAPRAGGDVPADPAAISEARLVQAALEGIVGLTARFTQTLESPSLPSPQVERGVVYLLRPGRIRFEYDEPKGKLAIADGRRTVLFLPDEQQVLVAPLGSEGTESGLSLLIEDRIDLVGRFDVALGPAGDAHQPRPLLLTPRSPRSEYRSLVLEPDPEHLVRALTVIDALDSRVTYRFTHVRRVGALDTGLFEFTPPPGVVVREAGR